MNILFVIENYLPHIGGVEMAFKNLCEGLARKGHDITIITHRLPNTPANETIKGVRVKRISCLGSRYLFTFLAIPPAIAAARKADIAHTTTFNGFFPAWIAAKLARKPLVATIHEVWVGKWQQYTDFGRLKSFLHALSERLIYLLPAVDRYVAVSNSTRQQLLRIGKKNSTVVYNGLDYDHYNPRKHNGAAVRKKHGLQKNYVLLVYGRPGPSKGIEYAIMAMKEISHKLPQAKMLLMLTRNKQYAGKYRQLLRLIEKLGVGSSIINVPPVPFDELPQYLKAADCVIVPSISEGFGYTAAEAAAMETPIIASNATSLPEVVSGTYILVPPKNSAAIADAVETIRRGKVKATLLRKFTVEKNVAGMVKIYGQLTRRT